MFTGLRVAPVVGLQVTFYIRFQMFRCGMELESHACGVLQRSTFNLSKIKKIPIGTSHPEGETLALFKRLNLRVPKINRFPCFSLALNHFLN